jgi:hypothetical protein
MASIFIGDLAPKKPHDFKNKRGDIMSEDLKAELERLKAENEALKSNKNSRGTLSMKVSEKGALSVYGMGRFPVTLYKEQWLKLLGIAEEIKKFIAENDDRLKTKE